MTSGVWDGSVQEQKQGQAYLAHLGLFTVKLLNINISFRKFVTYLPTVMWKFPATLLTYK